MVKFAPEQTGLAEANVLPGFGVPEQAVLKAWLREISSITTQVSGEPVILKRNLI
jgi:hypothetical protein